MKKQVKKTVFILLSIIIAILIFLRIGTFVTQNTDIQSEFIGNIAYDTDVYNLTDFELGVNDANDMWFWHTRGVPGIFQAFGAMQIKKIEIIESDWDRIESCGSFQINVYTRYNRMIAQNSRVYANCP